MKQFVAVLLTVVVVTPLLVLAQEAVVTPLPLEGVSSGIDKVTATILEYLPYIGGGLIAEIVGRLVKTNKPMGVIAGFGRLLGALGGLFLALDKGISYIVPQRLK